VKKYRLSVCKGPECRRRGSDALFATFKSEVQRQALTEHCEVYRAGCYGLCDLGPNVVVREVDGRPKDPFSPEDYVLMGWKGEVHYAAPPPAQVPEIVSEHIANDRPVPPERLQHPEPAEAQNTEESSRSRNAK
jgi:(2Fe-2S) ferredoxin